MVTSLGTPNQSVLFQHRIVYFFIVCFISLIGYNTKSTSKRKTEDKYAQDSFQKTAKLVPERSIKTNKVLSKTETTT